MAAFKDRTVPADDKEAADVMLATTVVDGGSGGDDEEEDMRCGIGPCRSRWMQVFASKQVFLAMFCFSWVLQGMFSTYFVSVITTLERLFQFQSKTMGVVLSATEIGQIGSSLLLTYYGGQGHRPRWIASSMVLFGVAAFACSSPHFLFGHHQFPMGGGVTVAATAVNGTGAAAAFTTDPYYPSNVCVASTTGATNGSSTLPLSPQQQAQLCEDTQLEEQLEQSKNTKIVLAIFFTSLLGVGIGQTAVYTLGIPFIDDNVASRESPLYFSITIGVRILGPSFGFLLGAFCTSMYADLGTDPNMRSDNPRWVGAWWLGLVGISATLLLASVPMFAFPKRLPVRSGSSPQPSSASIHDVTVKKPLPPNGNGLFKGSSLLQPPPPPPYNGLDGTAGVPKGGPKAPKLKDFPTAIKRLLKNDILMYRTASSVLHLLPLAGIYTFLPKYFESQFHFPTHTANMVTGNVRLPHVVWT